MKIVYLHGWNSTPNSTKVLALKEHYDVIAPQLSNDPKEAYATIDTLLSSMEAESLILVGTSLGGYWANYFADKYARLALIINPSTDPNKTLGLDVKPTEVYSTGVRKTVLLAKDDEVLDYREAEDIYNCYGVAVHTYDFGGHRFHEMDIIREHLDELIHYYQRFISPKS